LPGGLSLTRTLTTTCCVNGDAVSRTRVDRRRADYEIDAAVCEVDCAQFPGELLNQALVKSKRGELIRF